ncbi:MAG: bifunctional hydroxymethylpyrimidine kinase/phosphomethylpyrimidine kinase [Marinilabilia sp.]
MRRYKPVMTIAGSDSGGGAGIQADLKTFSACGCYGTSAITAVTAQNTVGVHDIFPVPPDVIEKQIDAIMEDIGADAIKTGMLHSSGVIELVARKIQHYQVSNLVADPVMVSTSGHKLLQDEAIDALKNNLLPLARVITPNLPEASILLGREITSQKDLPDAARELSNGSVSVMLKAGHLTGDRLIDVFYNAEKNTFMFLKSKRINTFNTHGTGCTLSSAIASFLALDNDLDKAIRLSKNYMEKAIAKGAKYKTGQGHGPVHHFFKWWS